MSAQNYVKLVEQYTSWVLSKNPLRQTEPLLVGPKEKFLEVKNKQTQTGKTTKNTTIFITQKFFKGI